MANPKSDAFLQLHREIASFRGESAFSTWLHRLAVNVILMHLCKKGPPQISHEETLEPTEEGGPEKEYGFEDQVLAGSSDRLVLERAIENLPPAIAYSSSCTMSKDTSTIRLPRCWDARLATANRNFIRRG